jgi:PPP family 3-phenylpropionic acid transporter
LRNRYFLIIPRIFAKVTPRRLIWRASRWRKLSAGCLGWTGWCGALHALTFGTYHAAAVALIHQHFRGRQ